MATIALPFWIINSIGLIFNFNMLPAIFGWQALRKSIKIATKMAGNMKTDQGLSSNVPPPELEI